jgi:hypothetical protein
MPHDHSDSPPKPRTTIPQPYCTIGAGRLTSFVWKTGNQDAGWRYRFNLFRMTHAGAQVSQLYKPSDLMHLVKLVQVMASVLLDDGCIGRTERSMLRNLAKGLDKVTARSATSASSEDQFTDYPEDSPHHQHDGMD